MFSQSRGPSCAKLMQRHLGGLKAKNEEYSCGVKILRGGEDLDSHYSANWLLQSTIHKGNMYTKRTLSHIRSRVFLISIDV
jgi:hypothetical protein